MKRTIYTIKINNKQWEANKNEICKNPDTLAFVKPNKDYVIVNKWLSFIEAIKAYKELIKFNYLVSKDNRIVMRRGVIQKYY